MNQRTHFSFQWNSFMFLRPQSYLTHTCVCTHYCPLYFSYFSHFVCIIINSLIEKKKNCSPNIVIHIFIYMYIPYFVSVCVFVVLDSIFRILFGRPFCWEWKKYTIIKSKVHSCRHGGCKSYRRRRKKQKTYLWLARKGDRFTYMYLPMMILLCFPKAKSWNPARASLRCLLFLE
jgi:hypothetical protein